MAWQQFAVSAAVLAIGSLIAFFTTKPTSPPRRPEDRPDVPPRRPNEASKRRRQRARATRPTADETSEMPEPEHPIATQDSSQVGEPGLDPTAHSDEPHQTLVTLPIQEDSLEGADKPSLHEDDVAVSTPNAEAASSTSACIPTLNHPTPARLDDSHADSATEDEDAHNLTDPDLNDTNGSDVEATADAANGDDVDGDDAWVLINPLLQYLPEGRTSFEGSYHIAVVGTQGAGKTTLVTDLRAMAEILSEGSRPNGVQLSEEELRDLEMVQEMVTEAVSTADSQNIIARRQQLIDNGRDVDRPGVGNDNRDPTPWLLSDTVTLWDLPGAGTAQWPATTVVDDMGLRHMSAVVVVVGLQESEVVNEVMDALHDARIPIILVQTHFDDYLRKELQDQHRAWLVSNPQEGRQFLSQEMVDRKIEQRSEELTRIYNLQPRDHVHCVNLKEPCKPDLARFMPFEASNYQLEDMRVHILDVARAAHA
eukprot:m.52652 g.52652  ORF g.52652 m.52652 type:complete len:481 (-) comp13516_c0_seq1:96-1538(-)